MSTEESVKKRYLCKYQVKSFVLMKEEDKIELDHSNVLSIEYLNDYEFNVMAMLKVVVRVDIRKKLWILKNKKDALVKFELNKIGMDSEVESETTSQEECWNHEFAILLNDEDEATDVEAMEQRLTLNEGEFQTNNIQTENYYESQNVVDLYLFHPQLLKASRYSFNRVYTESTLQNIVGEMLTTSKHKNVLMSKFENDEVYKELLVPVNPIYKCLIYLDQYYGFYEKGAIIYYDIDTLYILNSNGKVTVHREDEWTETSILVLSMGSTQPGNGMSRVIGENIYYPIVSEMEVNPQKFSIGKNVELGSEAKIVVSDNVNIDIHEADQSFINERNEKVVFVKEENKYTGNVLKARMEENDCIMYISGENMDINAFRPNKTFHMIFDDTLKHEKYGKNDYRLAYAYHFIKLESSNFMSAAHRIILKKTDGPELLEDPNRTEETEVNIKDKVTTKISDTESKITSQYSGIF